MPKPLHTTFACALGILALACAHTRPPVVESQADSRQKIENASRASASGTYLIVWVRDGAGSWRIQYDRLA